MHNGEMTIHAGRYAPSPSGDLHFGNLRTAVLAWLCARSTGREFVVRVEDIDTQRSSMESAQRQLEDLAALGIDWDREVEYQSQRYELYDAALERLRDRGLVFECYCSRKDIQEASRAPHSIPGHYPGTCRDLTEGERRERREALVAQGRVPALRLRAGVRSVRVRDELMGEYVGDVDDFILRRGGNAAQIGPQGPDWAYNLAVVVDDGEQGVDQVVRGDDLLPSAPRQAYLAGLLGYAVPEYVHVPLVLNERGERLAKRDGAVTLREMLETATVPEVLGAMAASLGMGSAGVHTAADLLDGFSMATLPRTPSVFTGV